MATVILDTTDLGEAENVLSAVYTRMRFFAKPDQPIRTRVQRTMVGALAVDELHYGHDFNFEGDPLDSIVLSRIRSGALSHAQPGADGVVSHADTVTAIGARQDAPFNGRNHAVEVDCIPIPRTLLDSVASGSPRYGGSAPTQITGLAPVSTAANAHLVAVVDHLIHHVATNSYAVGSPLVAGNVARYLAASMLAAFPSTALFEPTIEDRHDSTPVLMRRAAAFIDDNAHRDIATTDIAEAVYVTPRALQYMFRKHRDCTPMEYVRLVRLHHAHLDLIAGDRAETTVAAIARKWGFAHLGRFAAHYRQQYGESPQQTLRR
jgi:AraC-like DNA-binding protein